MKIPIYLKIYFLLIIISIKANISLYLVIPTITTPLLLYYLLNLKDNKEKTSIKNSSLIMIILSIITIFIIEINICDKIYLLLLFFYYISLKLKLDIKDNNKYLRTIVIKKVLNDPTKYIKDFYKSSINIILVSKNKYKYFKSKEEITNKDIYNNISIPNFNIIKPYILDTTLVLEDDTNIKETYNNIKDSRGKIDNLLRANKIKNILFISLLLTIILLHIFDFKTSFSLDYLTITIILCMIVSYLSLLFPYDSDIMKRKPLYKNNQLTSKEDIFFNIISIVSISIGSTLIYMYLIANQIEVTDAMPYLYTSILLSNLFTIIYLYSERISILNFILSFKCLVMLIIYLFYIFYIYIYLTKPIIWINILIIVIINIIIIYWQDMIKLFRYLTIRKSDKNAKNN